MDEDIKNLIQRNLEVSEKTLTILKKIRRETMFDRVVHVVKWVILIALLIFIYIKIQPYVAQWMQLLDTASQDIQKLNNVFH